MAELGGSEAGNLNPGGKIIEFPQRRRRIVFPSASDDVRGLISSPEQTRNIDTPEVESQIPRFPPAELILSGEKEAQVEEIKKTFTRPTKEGIIRAVGEVKGGDNDMSDALEAMSDWFNRSWWTWYEGDEKNPFDYKDSFDSNNPMEREHATNAMIQEILIRSAIRGEGILEGERIIIEGLLEHTRNAWAMAEEVYDFKSGKDPSEASLFENPYVKDQKEANKALFEVSEKTKNQFGILLKKGVPVLARFVNKYVEMDMPARKAIQDTGSFLPREVAAVA